MFKQAQHNNTGERVMKTKYFVQDKTGDVCFDGEEFESVEDAWNFIREFVEVELKEDGIVRSSADIDDAFNDKFREYCRNYFVSEAE